MVTSGLSFWNAATQASDALLWEEAPEPLISPENVPGEPPGASGCGISAAPHADRTMVLITAMAARLPKRMKFTVFPFEGYRFGAGVAPTRR